MDGGTWTIIIPTEVPSIGVNRAILNLSPRVHFTIQSARQQDYERM